MRKLSQVSALSLLLTLMASFLLPIQNVSGQPSSPQEESTQEIESVGPVYFVRIWGGDFPLPVSYELNIGAALRETPTHLEFGSPAIPLIDNPATLKPSNIGSITIGSYHDYIEKYGEPYAKKSSVQTMECYGLTILITPATESKLQRLGYKNVFIHNNDQYIEIGAVNGDLWKGLLKRFGETIEKPPGQDCQMQNN